MTIYIISSNYFASGIFGAYSSVKRARIAFEDFLMSNEGIISFENTSNYTYQFTTKNNETFGAEIYWNAIDAEFETGMLKEED